MHVWLVHPGEPLATDGPVRLLRYGLLSKMLHAAGNQVTQWCSTFDHYTKRHRATASTRLTHRPGHDVELLHGRAYQRHIGWARIRSHQEVAAAFRERAAAAPRADVIVTAIPTLELSTAVVNFAREQNIPCMVDVRDLWPDVYLTALPVALRPFARPLLRPWERTAQALCRNATAMYGVSEDYLQWGLRHAGRAGTADDRVFPLGYHRPALTADARREAEQRWERRGVRQERTLRCCYFGILGNSSGMDHLIRTARLLHQQGDGDIEFIICGTGPNLAAYQRQARDLPNMKFVGWVEPAEIQALMARSDIGLATYAGGALQSIPNKPIEYLAGGLPVLSALRGELERLLAEHGAGVTVAAHDAAEMARLLSGWKRQPEARRQMATRAFALFTRQFDADQVYREMIEHLGQLARRAGDRTRVSRAA